MTISAMQSESYSSIKYWALFLCVTFLFYLAPAIALETQATQSILFIMSKDAPAYSQVVDFVESNLSATRRSYSFRRLLKNDSSELAERLKDADIIVTVGAGATETAMKEKPVQPLIAALITDSAFSALANNYYGSTPQALAARVSVIFLDQPVQRSIKLAKLLVPSASSTGLMLGPASQGRGEEFSQYASEVGLTANLVNIESSDNPILAIEPVLAKSDVFIPVPDSRLINIASAKWILQLSYRYRIPVIAYSKTYLNAGALAAIYSSPENVGRQTSELILNQSTDITSKGGAHMPAYFSVQFNTTVAGHLRIPLEETQFYIDRLLDN